LVVVADLSSTANGVFNAAENIIGGMSGSPIVDDDGAAVGVLCTSSGGQKGSTEGGPNPRLTHNLPGWVLREAQPD
jgi:hypothetical protein